LKLFHYELKIAKHNPKPALEMPYSSVQTTAHTLFYFIGLTGFILTLPLLEAPKTLCLLLFFAASAYGLWRHNQSTLWRGDDLLLLLWMLSGFVVAFFAGLHNKEWGGANGPLLFGLLLLFLKHSHFNSKQIDWLFYAILLSTLIANSYGLWQLLVSGQKKALELKSVGHVNHSAIYLCLNFAAALAMTLTLKRHSAACKVFILACVLLTAVSVVLSNSRATIATMGLIALSFGMVWIKRSKWPLVLLLLSVAAAAGSLYFNHARVVQKHQIHTMHSFLGERQSIWNSAVLIWRHNPLFGIGIKNYGEASPQIQEQWLAQEGQHYDGKQYLAYAHAHSFYLTNLAEQGLFGLGTTLAVLLRIAWLLYRRRPRAADGDDYWMVWLAAFGTLQVVLLNGIFNTTLHHEHGLLSVLLLGLWWSQAEQSPTVKAKT
jgi:O-antigen ligase